MRRSRFFSAVGGLCAGTAAACLTGCARQQTREQLEQVAKGWCETIRASQVVPVYPLTEDLEPGDVFLVQTSIQAEADVYQRKGFLPLDDRRVRLAKPGYDRVYFDGYWADRATWGTTPHTRPDRAKPGAVGDGAAARLLLTLADAPRVAFPSYSFEIRASGAFGLALPIKGVPVGLSYMRTDSAHGTVTIADARTYAGDPWTLYKALRDWSEEPDVERMLADTVEQSGRAVFLRVVTRVYLTGAVVVSLRNTSTRAGGATAGRAPDVGFLNADGSVNDNFTKAAETLSSIADPKPTDAGGRIKFIQASSRDVVLAESFDRLLGVGYLGFDVPVFEGGVLGVPIPTYQRLERIDASTPRPINRLSPRQAQVKIAEHALEAYAKESPARALKVMRDTVTLLGDPTEFEEAAAALRDAGDGADAQKFKAALAAYKLAAVGYVSKGGATGPRYDRYLDAFARAYDKRDEE